MKYFLFLFIFVSYEVHAKKTICELLDIDGCYGKRYGRSSSVSVPTSKDTFNFNPAGLPTDKGFGAELILRPNLEYDVGITGGSGRVGGGVSPHSAENIFFANLGYESLTAYQERKRTGAKYKSPKISLAFATNVFGRGKGGKNKNVVLNLGLLSRYNTDLQIIRPGAGLTLELWFVNIAASVYRDDNVNLDTNDVTGVETVAYSGGIKLPYVAMDYSYMKNNSLRGERDQTLFTDFGAQGGLADEFSLSTNEFPIESEVTIYSASAFIKGVIATYGYRTETSFRPMYDYETKEFHNKKKKTYHLYGLQYGLAEKYYLGIYYNYYLLEDFALGMTLFF